MNKNLNIKHYCTSISWSTLSGKHLTKLPSLVLVATTDCGDSEMVCDVVRITSTGGGESVAAAAAGSTGIKRLDASVLITPALLVRVSCITVAAQTKGDFFFFLI